MKKTIKAIVLIYLGLVLGSHVGIVSTNHIRPKGLWNLVPFRIGGWNSRNNRKKIFNQNWVWEDLDFDNVRYTN